MADRLRLTFRGTEQSVDSMSRLHTSLKLYNEGIVALIR
jgi:hypothetical protein